MALNICNIFALVIVLSAISIVTSDNLYQQNIISKVRESGATWEAGLNFPSDASEEYFQSLIGTFEVEPKIEQYKVPKCSEHVCDKNMPQSLGHNDGDYPTNFDARKKWPQCPSIGKVHDQGNCKSDWAISVTSAIQDRICIATNATKKTTISAQQVISCCQDCGRGCKGGFSQEAWRYFHRRGIVSGGHYESKEGCQPYLFKPTGFKPTSLVDSNKLTTPKCSHVCYNGNYPTKSVKKDLHKGTDPSGLCCALKGQLNDKGPVTTSMLLFEDFLTYKSGIYQHVHGKRLGRISVKVIGYGEENKKPYYIAINSWSESWGDKGTFKIWKENNHCEFSEYMFTGEPIV